MTRFLAAGSRQQVLIVIVAVLGLGNSVLVEAQPARRRSSTSGQLKTTDSSVNRAAAKFMSNGCHVGLSIAVVRETETRFYNYGSTSRNVKDLPSADSVYEVASVTKTFTGVLAAKAVTERRMDLDGDFRKYLPQPYPNLAFEGYPITLRSLATHRSGLPRDLPDTDDLYAHPDFERLPYKLIERDSAYDRSRYLRELHTVRLKSRPGTKEVYSNLGMKVIGFALEVVYNAPFEVLIRQNILEPLHMSSTGFVVNAEQGRLVHGYSRGGNAMPYHLRNAGAAYGLYSSTRDMAKYVQWQLNESDPVIHLAHSLLYRDTDDGQALIWNVTTKQGSRILWHGGGTFGMTSQVVLFPDDKEGYVLLANDTCEGTEAAMKDIAIAVHKTLEPKPH
ncbi:MAG TPA: serine hydrolase domain-containing protein [Terriglobales bacterium]|nr:serine hydrolase domain-containing protein [Terriglobales bacterium]